MLVRYKNDPSDIVMRPNSFTDCIYKELGQKFFTHIEIDKYIGLLVLYLQEEVPNQISYRKLTLAMTQSYNEPPLTQHGAEELKQYKNTLKRQLKNEIISPSLNEFSQFLSSKKIGLKRLLKQT